MNNIKAVIFDWGRTLWDNDINQLDHGAKEVLDYCFSKYKLGLVSIATHESAEQRHQKITNLGFDKYFSDIEIIGAADVEAEGKDHLLEKVAKNLGVAHQSIAIVGDRVFREIQWGNQHGCVTIWLQKGKFANELPNAETGEPTHVIHELKELRSILK